MDFEYLNVDLALVYSYLAYAAMNRHFAEAVAPMMDIGRGQSMKIRIIVIHDEIRVAGMSRQIIHSAPRFDRPGPSNTTSYQGK